MKRNLILIAAALLFAACVDKEQTSDGITANGAIDALFSVGPSHQVRFSRGNLQYQATTNTWRFAEHQFDRIGGDNASISSYYGGWIDLFGWGTSGFDNGNTYYKPYDHDFVDDYSVGMGYGPLPATSYNLVGEYANCDWGVYNAISNGGQKAGMWRTLTADEWTYLFTLRTNAENKYGIASIEGRNGLVVLPDSWTLPEGCSFNPGMGAGDGRDYFAQKNSYTLEQWNEMQAHGAVFLPAAGSRQEFCNIVYVEEMGRYWSTTRCTIPLFDDFCAICAYFDSEELLPADHNNPRDYGRAVRLVCDAE